MGQIVHGIRGIMRNVGTSATDMAVERLAVCLRCPRMVETPVVGPRCLDCSCILKLKVKDAQESCPNRFW